MIKIIWDKQSVRDVLNLFGGKIKNIVTTGGVSNETRCTEISQNQSINSPACNGQCQ